MQPKLGNLRRKWTEEDAWSIGRLLVIARNAAPQEAATSSFDVAHAASSSSST